MTEKHAFEESGKVVKTTEKKTNQKSCFDSLSLTSLADNRLIRMAKLLIEKANRLLLLKRVFNKDVPLSLWWTPLL